MTDGYMEWKGWEGRPFGQLDPEDTLYFPKELRACGVESLQGLKVGEIGFGNGSFAAWVRQHGGQWVGREANPALRERAATAGFQVLGEGEPFSSCFGAGELDLLAAFDVLEHIDLDAIRALLLEVKEALRPGGIFMFRVPSGDSPFSGAIFRGDCTHRTLLGSSAVQQLALEAGLEVRQIRPPVLPFSGLDPVRLLRRALVRSAQAIVFGFIRNLLMSQPSAVVSPNMLVVLRKA
jgi:SAM-dependent methyltransferase